MRFLVWQWHLIHVKTLQIFSFVILDWFSYYYDCTPAFECGSNWFGTNDKSKESNNRLATMVYIHHSPNCGMCVLQELVPLSKTKGL
jgi:hypothetical protein